MTILIATLLACGPSPDTFAEDFPVAYCDYSAACLTGEAGAQGSGLCMDAVDLVIGELSGDPDCDYQRDAARDCMDMLELGECSEAADMLDVCSDVYQGGGCSLL